MNSRRINSQSGLTLIELAVSISIFIVLFLLAGDFVTRGFKSTAFSMEQDEAVQSARNAMNFFAKELREANQADTGSYLLDTVSPQELSFFTNIDSDASREKVRYFIDGHDFKKGVINATGNPLSYPVGDEIITVISGYINNQATPAFTYYDASNAEIANPAAQRAQIRMIKAFLMINVTPDVMPADYFMDTYVQIRNLKDNL